MHTDNHVDYVYLGINYTKIKQICNTTDMNTVTALLLCFIPGKYTLKQDPFKPEEVGHTANNFIENMRLALISKHLNNSDTDLLSKIRYLIHQPSLILLRKTRQDATLPKFEYICVGYTYTIFLQLKPR